MPVIGLERKTKPKGKVWTSLGALNGHLTLVADGGRYIPEGTSSMGPGVSSHRCSHCGHPTQTNMLGGPG